jgi:hypothetical protein
VVHLSPVSGPGAVVDVILGPLQIIIQNAVNHQYDNNDGLRAAINAEREAHFVGPAE